MFLFSGIEKNCVSWNFLPSTFKDIFLFTGNFLYLNDEFLNKKPLKSPSSWRDDANSPCDVSNLNDEFNSRDKLWDVFKRFFGNSLFDPKDVLIIPLPIN